jgi:hypothetical protein
LAVAVAVAPWTIAAWAAFAALAFARTGIANFAAVVPLDQRFAGRWTVACIRVRRGTSICRGKVGGGGCAGIRLVLAGSAVGPAFTTAFAGFPRLPRLCAALGATVGSCVGSFLARRTLAAFCAATASTAALTVARGSLGALLVVARCFSAGDARYVVGIVRGCRGIGVGALTRALCAAAFTAAATATAATSAATSFAPTVSASLRAPFTSWAIVPFRRAGVAHRTLVVLAGNFCDLADRDCGNGCCRRRTKQVLDPSEEALFGGWR